MCVKSDVYSEQVIFQFPIICWNLILRTVFAYCDYNPNLLSFLQLQNPGLHKGVWMEPSVKQSWVLQVFYAAFPSTRNQARRGSSKQSTEQQNYGTGCLLNGCHHYQSVIYPISQFH